MDKRRLRNRFVSCKYKKILSSSRVIVFGELSLVGLNNLKSLKVMSKKEGFYFKVVKNAIFRKYIQKDLIKDFVNSHVFILYNEGGLSGGQSSLNFLINSLGSHKYISSYFYEGKLYSSLIFNECSGVSKTEYFYLRCYEAKSLLGGRLNVMIKQLSGE